jgi:hypothetical protein
MVDSACCVRITRYVDEIAYKRTDVEAIVVLSQDIDLKPAIDYAVSMSVPIFAVAVDVVQHRSHPFILMGPHAYAEMTGASGVAKGHGLRERLVRALCDQQPLSWKVKGTPDRPLLRHSSGLMAVPAPGVTPGPLGATQALYPVDVIWDARILGSFPLVVCDTTLPGVRCWEETVVRRRMAPMTVEVVRGNGTRHRGQFPLGGVVPGDSVLVHRQTGRLLGRLGTQGSQSFDPDTPQVLRVTTRLPRGGALVVDAGSRGLLTTDQILVPGQRVPAVQIDVNNRGAVWAAIGTPLP